MSEEDTLGVLDSVLDSSDNTGSATADAGSDDSGSSTDASGNAIAGLTKSVEGMQSLMGKWANEMGNMRNNMSAQNQPAESVSESTSGASDETWNKLMEDPEAFMNEKFAKLSQEQSAKTQQQISETREQLRQHDPKADEYTKDMVEIIAKDTGWDESRVANEFHKLGAPTLVNVLERAKVQKENTALKSLVEAMKGSGADMEAAKRALMKTPSSGESYAPPSQADTPKVHPRDMSDDDLKDMYAKRIKT